MDGRDRREDVPVVIEKGSFVGIVKVDWSTFITLQGCVKRMGDCKGWLTSERMQWVLSGW